MLPGDEVREFPSGHFPFVLRPLAGKPHRVRPEPFEIGRDDDWIRPFELIGDCHLAAENESPTPNWSNMEPGCAD